MSFHLKLHSYINETDLCEELNLFGKIILQEKSTQHALKLMFRTNLSEVITMVS